MFANPYMLVGLGVAVLPIVIHLLSRARYRTVDWGAMMFLEGATAQFQSRSRPRQILLLAIRALIIGLLALALARPELPTQFSRAASGVQRPGAAVILLDCSASMAFEESGHPRMEMAKEAAQQLLSLHRGDRVSLVLMGQNQLRTDRTPTADLWQVGRRIESAEIGYGRCDVSRGLDEAIEALEPRETPPAGQLVTFYIVTDRQATNWREVLEGGDEWTAQWRQKAARVSSAARIVVIPVGSPEAENLVVRSIEPVSGSPIAGQPLEIEVTVQNIGPVQWASLPLALKIDGSSGPPEQRINLAPDSSIIAHFSLPGGISEPGTHVVSAEIGRPGPAGSIPPAATAAPAAASAGGASRSRVGGLAGDDRLEVVIDVQEPTRVLLIRGDEPAATGGASAITGSQYVATALTPFRSAKKRQADPCVVEALSPAQWNGASYELPPTRTKRSEASSQEPNQLGSNQVVILSNVERLDSEQLSALEQFVNDGGGLIIIPGELTRPEEMDRLLYRDGSGLAPAALAPATAADMSDQTFIAAVDFSHPALRFLARELDAAATISIGRYLPAPRVAPSARVLMRLATGDPLLLESPPTATRRGKVLMFTSSFDAEWTSLAKSNLVVPLLQNAVRYLSEPPSRKLNVLPGEPIEVPLEGVGESRMVRLKPPGPAEERTIAPLRSGGDLVVRYGDTETPGIYTIKLTEPGQKPLAIQVAVTPPRDESNLTPLNAAEWKRLERIANLQRLDPSLQPISAAAALPAPVEIWPYALGAVFLLGILEMKLSPRMQEPDATE